MAVDAVWENELISGAGESLLLLSSGKSFNNRSIVAFPIGEVAPVGKGLPTEQYFHHQFQARMEVLGWDAPLRCIAGTQAFSIPPLVLKKCLWARVLMGLLCFAIHAFGARAMLDKELLIFASLLNEPMNSSMKQSYSDSCLRFCFSFSKQQIDYWNH